MTLGWRGDWGRRGRIAIEIGAVFAVLVLADRLWTGGTGFAGLQPNPLWLPVLVMAVAYGTGPAIAAAGIATALWLGQAHAEAGERDYLDHLFHLSLQPLLWFVAAVAIGEVTMIRAARRIRLDRRAGTATRNIARLTDAFDRLSRTNRALQVRIATEAGTMGHVIATATRLSASEPAERRASIAQLIALATRTEDYSCYRIVGGEARAWLRGAATAGQRDVLPDATIERVARRGVAHVARRGDRAALDGVGVAAVALRTGGTIVGCLVLHDLPHAVLDAHRVAEMAEIETWLTPLLADVPRPMHRSVRPAGLVA